MDTYQTYLTDIIRLWYPNVVPIIIVVDGNNILYDYEYWAQRGMMPLPDLALVIWALYHYFVMLWPENPIFLDFVLKDTPAYGRDQAEKAISQLHLPVMISHITNSEWKSNQYRGFDDVVIWKKIATYSQIATYFQTVHYVAVVTSDQYEDRSGFGNLIRNLGHLRIREHNFISGGPEFNHTHDITVPTPMTLNTPTLMPFWEADWSQVIWFPGSLLYELPIYG